MNGKTIFVILLCLAAVPAVMAAGDEVQDFIASPTTGYAPLTVTFTSTSHITNVTDYQWNYFRVQSPWENWSSFSADKRDTTFTFTNPGTYHIMQSEFTPDYPKGHISTTKQNFVTVNAAPSPTPTPTPTPTPAPIPTIKKDTVGIFRPATGYWYLDTDGNGIYDISVYFGTKGDVPMPGDYNGDGITDLAVFRPSTGYWYFDYNRDGLADNSFRYGGSTDIPVSGIWK